MPAPQDLTAALKVAGQLSIIADNPITSSRYLRPEREPETMEATGLHGALLEELLLSKTGS
jgi:hypothetical protein